MFVALCWLVDSCVWSILKENYSCLLDLKNENKKGFFFKFLFLFYFLASDGCLCFPKRRAVDGHDCLFYHAYDFTIRMDNNKKSDHPSDWFIYYYYYFNFFLIIIIFFWWIVLKENDLCGWTDSAIPRWIRHVPFRIVKLSIVGPG